VATVTEAVASLFPEYGSGVGAAISAVPERIVPAAAAAGTFMTIGKLAVPPTIMDGLVQVIVPTCPTAGVEHVQPAGGANETKVALMAPAALLAVGSVKTRPDAVAGPLLVTTAVIVKFEPAMTVGEEAVLVTARSAWVPELTVVMAVALLLVRFGSLVPEVT